MEGNKYIFFEMSKCARLAKRFLDNSTDKARFEKMTGAHGWAVGFLYHNRDRDIFQRDFEKECNVRRSSATEMLKRMEKNGIITRESVDYDARLKKIVLTEKAVEIQEEIEKKLGEFETRLAEGIDDDELKTFFTVLSKIRKNIGEEDADD